MATTVSSTKTQPAVVMDKLHIDSFTLTQKREMASKKVIGMSGVLHGCDADGNCVFDSETFSVSDTDIETTVAAAALAGGATIEEFMATVVTARADVTAEIAGGTLDDAKLMAYFEAALGRILELHGKITISSVE